MFWAAAAITITDKRRTATVAAMMQARQVAAAATESVSTESTVDAEQAAFMLLAVTASAILMITAVSIGFPLLGDTEMCECLRRGLC